MLTLPLCNATLRGMEHLISTAEACKRLGFKDRSSLTRYVAEGRITPAMKLDGKTGAYLFDDAEVERFKAEREAAA